MKTDEREMMQQKIDFLQGALEEYRLYADFSLAMQMILHNIKNSTAGSLGSAEIIEMAVDNLLKKIHLDLLTPEELNNELLQIKTFSRLNAESVRKIVTLSQDILVKAKADKSHEIESFDLNNLIRNEVRFLKYTAPFVKSQINIELNLSEAPILISARKHDIIQIFENLVHNAIEIMKGEGQIVIRTVLEQDAAYFYISDTGPGIDPMHLEKIFEPFFTTKKETDEFVYFGGAGLGLHSCKRLIESYGGSISVNGNLNPGSEFMLKLVTT